MLANSYIFVELFYIQKFKAVDICTFKKITTYFHLWILLKQNPSVIIHNRHFSTILYHFTVYEILNESRWLLINHVPMLSLVVNWLWN